MAIKLINQSLSPTIHHFAIRHVRYKSFYYRECTPAPLEERKLVFSLNKVILTLYPRWLGLSYFLSFLAMRIRIRGPTGSSAITLPATATVEELQRRIAESTSVLEFDVKIGYPPKPLLLHQYAATSKVSEIGINLDGEQLIVSPRQVALGNGNVTEPLSESVLTNVDVKPDQGDGRSKKLEPRAAGAPPPLSLTRKPPLVDAPELPLPSHASTILLRIMPDDNSCLFRAFGSALFGDLDNMTELRSIIAQNIQTAPDVYSEVVLDQPIDQYCGWIQTADAWGGAIELGILSKHFDLEICSIDVQTLRVDRFNEGRPTRCILVYSGIHYDTIALSPSDPPFEQSYAPPEFDTKIFNSDDEAILEKAVELCRVLQGQHYFTDTAAFSVKCNICGGIFTGEAGATEHAKKTGHYDFGEAG